MTGKFNWIFFHFFLTIIQKKKNKGDESGLGTPSEGNVYMVELKLT